MSMSEKLTNDQVADFYGEKTDRPSRILSLEAMYEWAVKQEEIGINEDTTLYFKKDI